MKKLDLNRSPYYSVAVEDNAPCADSKQKEVTRNETRRSHLRAFRSVRGSGRSFRVPLVFPPAPQPAVGNRRQPSASLRTWIAYLPGHGTCPITQVMARKYH